MKLSKASWLFLTGGFFIIAFVALGAVGYSQANQQNQMKKELASAQERLEQTPLEPLSYQEGKLEEQLGQTLSRLESAKAKLSLPMDSIDTSSILFNIAEASGVEIISIKLSGVGSHNLGGVPCSVLRLSGSIKGDLVNLVNFIIKLNDYFPTGVVDSITITIPEGTGDEKASASMQLITYAYQGD